MQNQNEKPVLKTIRERHESQKKVGNPAFDLPYSNAYKRILLESPDARAIAQMRENLIHDMGTLLEIVEEAHQIVSATDEIGIFQEGDAKLFLKKMEDVVGLA